MGKALSTDIPKAVTWGLYNKKTIECTNRKKLHCYNPYVLHCIIQNNSKEDYNTNFMRDVAHKRVYYNEGK